MARKKPKSSPPVARKPYVCPVCQGQGTMPIGFYTGHRSEPGVEWSTSNLTGKEECRTCMGRGLVWYEEIVVGQHYYCPYQA